MTNSNVIEDKQSLKFQNFLSHFELKDCESKLDEFLNEYLNSNFELSLEHNLIILNRLESNHFNLIQNRISTRSDTIDNYKFKFATLVKYMLFQIPKETPDKLIFNINLLLLYVTNKSLKQFKLFKLNYDKDYKIINKEMFNDEISLIELMSEFRNKLLELMSLFRKTRIKYLHDVESRRFLFYDYIVILLSLYFDVTFEIKNKLEKLDDSEYLNSVKVNSMTCKLMFRLESLFDYCQISKSFSSLLFLYTDSVMYHIFNAILNLENLNDRNIMCLIPSLTKLVTEVEASETFKLSKSKYLQMILVYSKVKIYSLANPKFNFFKQFICNLKTRSEFESFYLKLIKKYSNSSILSKLSIESSYSSNDPNEKLRNSLLYNLNKNQLDELLKALKLRSYKKSKEFIDLIEYNFKLEVNNAINIKTEIEKTQISAPENAFQKQNVERHMETKQLEIDKDTDEKQLDFTTDYSPIDDSLSEATDDDDLFKPINQKGNLNKILITKSKQSEINKLEKSNLKRRRSFSDSNSDSSCKFSSSKFNKNKNLINSKKKDFDFVKQKSPTPTSISKLNLFRNIFANEGEVSSFNKMRTNKKNDNLNTEKKQSQFENYKINLNPVNKYYKLNDLVSVMINEDYFKSNKNF
ncbi:unnamed protein product [Brachionus calyciflorus]|uniref:Uncharacterized protein n=1 Tax=Brachionus calyciflorus TaxID=104777 RepID=A0A813M334_9BILA|nr:unnamed protein product [Brachionus calyciflorus]